MSELDDRILVLLRKAYEKTSLVGRTLSRVSGKVDEVEATLLLHEIARDSQNDDDLRDIVNNLFMIAKLRHSDRVGRARSAISKDAAAEIDAEERKRKREAQLLQDQIEAKRMFDKLRNPTSSREKDRLLTLMDKVNSSGLDNIKQWPDAVEILEKKYGIKLQKRGWLSPVYEWTDKAKAVAVRARIAKS